MIHDTILFPNAHSVSCHFWKHIDISTVLATLNPSACYSSVMSIFDSYSSSALERYETSDGYIIEIGYDQDPVPPEPGEYRLLDREENDLAYGFFERGVFHFARGDKDLWDLWEKYEDLEDPKDPEPVVAYSQGPSQGDEVVVVFPHDTKDSEEERNVTATLLGNYSFGSIYIVSITDPEGNEKVSYPIEHAGTDKEIDSFLYGSMSADEALEFAENSLTFCED